MHCLQSLEVVVASVVDLETSLEASSVDDSGVSGVIMRERKRERSRKQSIQKALSSRSGIQGKVLCE